MLPLNIREYNDGNDRITISVLPKDILLAANWIMMAVSMMDIRSTVSATCWSDSP